MKKNAQAKDFTTIFMFAAGCLAILALQFLNFSSQVSLQRSIDQLSARVESANVVSAKVESVNGQQ